MLGPGGHQGLESFDRPSLRKSQQGDPRERESYEREGAESASSK